MQLSEWLERANLSQKNFARVLGVSPACVSRLIRGGLRPSMNIITKIEDATNGDVGFEDWKRRAAASKADSLNGV
jgi:DNA-binding transcriptional regulator YdaS (Cro superfamily)